MKNGMWPRRSLMSGLGAAAATFAFGGRQANAQAPAPVVPFTPARHSQDEWLDKMPGKHRAIFDVTTAEGVPNALRFVGNFFDGSKSAYELEQADLGVIVVFRHSATAFGYGDALWTKYGKALAEAARYADPKSTEPPKTNPFNVAPRNAIEALAKRGVQFMVCATASRGISRLLAGPAGDADATFKEISSGLIPSGRLVVAGVIGVTRAQEYGYRLVSVG